MAKKQFRPDNGRVKKFGIGGGIGEDAPDPTSINPGFGAPSGIPGSMPPTTPPFAGGPRPGQAQPSQLQSLLKQLGPYASVGAMAGGIGGKKGILAAPAIALLMQQLLKQQPKKSGGPNMAPPIGTGDDPKHNDAVAFAKGGQIQTKEIKSMKREFRSNGPKVRNLQVSPRKAMGMGILSPTAIPALKKGGAVKDTDNDGMNGGGCVKYAKGGMVGYGAARGNGKNCKFD